MKTNKIIIGTRGSILALAQAEKVKEMLIEKYDELRQRDDFQGIEDFDKNSPLDIELKVIVTSGDKDLRDFTKIRGITQKDLFVKEIEKEMIENKIDLAVHSLKDMPQNTPAGLLNACFPLREDNRDVLVSAKGLKLDELPENAVVGTGSIRREKELLSLRKDLKIQCRENDRKIKNLLKIINDREVTLICEAEREFSRIFDGGCHTPIGCSSVIEGDILKLKGMYNDNGNRIFKEVSGNKENPKEIAQKLAKEIRNE